MKFNYDLLFSEVKRKGFKKQYVADLIGVNRTTLSSKISGNRKQELSATQVAIICDILRSPFSMFLIKEEHNEL